MREALTEALQDYEGALVVVAHDRHLLRATTDALWLVADGKVAPFDGDLDDYRDWVLTRGGASAEPEDSQRRRRSQGEKARRGAGAAAAGRCAQAAACAAGGARARHERARAEKGTRSTRGSRAKRRIREARQGHAQGTDRAPGRGHVAARAPGNASGSRTPRRWSA